MALQKKRPARRNSTVYHVKQNAKIVANYMMVSTLIFMIVLVLAGAFILYQWKDLAVNNCLKDIDRLHARILRLNSEKSVLEQQRNDLLKDLPRRAKTLGLRVPTENGEQIVLSLEKLNRYE